MSVQNASLVPGEHERDLAAALRSMAADLLHPAALRTSLDTDTGYAAATWKVVSEELGLCGLTVPEEFGGLGLGWGEVNTVHVELGRSLFPGPFLPTSLAVSALRAVDDVTAHERWLPGIATGQTVATVAGPTQLRAERDERGWTLSGSHDFVIAAHAADVLFLVADTQTGPALFAIERGADGLRVDQLEGLDLTRRVGRVTLADTRAVLVGEPGQGAAAIDAVARHLRLAVSAEAVGGLEWCVSTCVEYAKTRKQFGKAIGEFQAVAHACVDIYAAAQRGGAAARWAACAAVDNSPEAELAGYVAALRTGEDYRTQTESAIHVLGGIGFTWEHEAHLYYRRARSALALVGGPAANRARIAELAGLGPVS
jgi:acyl-CoA dehydrogenase